MTIFLTVVLIGILIMISSIFFYFVLKYSIRNGINESGLVDNNESNKE